MIEYIDELKKEDLAGKKVLLRVDFDVPIERLGVGGWKLDKPDRVKIGESFRIKAQKETVDYLMSAGAKVLLVAHLGHEVSDASFAPVVEEVGTILGHKIQLIPHKDFFTNHWSLTTDRLLLLDNIRQDPREVKNDDKFAAELAKGFDLYINNDFAVAHRKHASVVAVTKHLPSYAGLLVKKEIENLSRAVEAPAEGKILVLGGAKISTKMPVIKNFVNKVEKILIGGALANDFFRVRGIDVGDSLVDDSVSPDIESDKLILPEDVIISQSVEGDEEARPYPVRDIAPGHYMPDIGPETAKHYADTVKKSKMVIWNGPMGKFEIDAFAEGTRVIAEAAAEATRSIIGGGDTIAALDKFGLLDKMGFISTGGGAMLEFLAGNKLPGLEALGYYN